MLQPIPSFPFCIPGTGKCLCLFVTAVAKQPVCVPFAWAKAILIACIRLLCAPFYFYHAGNRSGGSLQNLSVKYAAQNDVKMLHVAVSLFSACCHHRNLCI